MEIKPIPKIIEEMNILVSEEKFDEAIEFAKENVNLNKEYVEGEYVFKNLLEELLFQITINKEIKKKIPLILDYSSLYSNYGNVLLHFNEYDNALKSFKLAYDYNPVIWSGHGTWSQNGSTVTFVFQSSGMLASIPVCGIPKDFQLSPK